MATKEPWWKNRRGEWYAILQFVFFALVIFGPQSLPGQPPWGRPWSIIGVVVGLFLGLIGALLMVAGVVSLGTNLTVLPHPKDDSNLIETGAYRLVRHPIYSGVILGAFGWALLVNGTLTLLYALLVFLFLDLKSRQEERWLSRRFAGYAAYKQRVHKLIPFVY